jgi:hypothetical protein
MLPMTGRKHLTTVRDDRKIERMALKNCKPRSSSLAFQLHESASQKITCRTIRRRLQERDLKNHRARKKPWLSADNIKSDYSGRKSTKTGRLTIERMCVGLL